MEKEGKGECKRQRNEGKTKSGNQFDERWKVFVCWFDPPFNSQSKPASNFNRRNQLEVLDHFFLPPSRRHFGSVFLFSSFRLWQELRKLLSWQRL